jgi:hypothetical protein
MQLRPRCEWLDVGRYALFLRDLLDLALFFGNAYGVATWGALYAAGVVSYSRFDN